VVEEEGDEETLIKVVQRHCFWLWGSGVDALLA